MVARLADLIGVDHIGIGSDLCQDQPDSVVAWMRNGRWTKSEPSIGLGAAVFPPQPSWFRDNRDFAKIRGRPAGPGLLGRRHRQDHGRQLVSILRRRLHAARTRLSHAPAAAGPGETT